MMVHTFRLALLSVLLTMSSSCLDSRRGEPLDRMVDVSEPNVAHGQDVYMRHCYSCHLAGEGGLAPAINNKPVPGFMLKAQVRLGLGKMPGFPKETISDDELDYLVEYVKELRRTERHETAH